MDHVVLLVDDLKSNVLLLEGMLSGMGYRFLKAGSGAEALALMETQTISLALLDVQMPGMDGHTLARQIRADDRHADVPIIFVTATANDDQSVAGAYDAGAIDYLVKPVDEHILRRKVQLLCALVEKERRIQEQLAEADRRNRELEDLLSRHRRLEEARAESESRYHSLISLAPMPVVVQVNDKIVYYNASAMHLLGMNTDGGIYPRPFHMFVGEPDRARVREKIEEVLRRGGRLDPVSCQLAAGNHVELNIGGILFDDEVGVQMAIKDVTPHKELEQTLRHLSQMDGLTGVANRRTFNEALAREWKRATRSAQPISLLMLDLDQFKAFNDRYGHLAGDECLKKAAHVLRDTASRPDDFVARYGGEEFIVILPNTALEGACTIAHAIVEGLRALKILHEGNLNRTYASFSCGVASSCPEYDKGVAQELVRLADEALYQQKQHGGDGVTVAPGHAPAS